MIPEIQARIIEIVNKYIDNEETSDDIAFDIMNLLRERGLSD